MTDHFLDTVHRFERTDQYRGREPFAFRHNIETVIHTVDEIDVRVAGGAVHDGVAGSWPGSRMTCRIILADIRFHLDDSPR